MSANIGYSWLLANINYNFYQLGAKSSLLIKHIFSKAAENWEFAKIILLTT